MEEVTLKSRAVVFALCVGVVAFILALLATSHGVIDRATITIALIPAIVCGAMSWASAERALSSTAAAIDLAIARLADAAEGDLDSPIPPEIADRVPQLASAMTSLFRQFDSDIEGIRRTARVDLVTGLPNRGHFREAAEAALAAPDMPGAALFFIDLDRFKAVNDTLGHARGDMLLAAVAGRLRVVAEEAVAASAATPLIGRLAGDEFTLLLPGIRETMAAARVGRSIQRALAEPFAIDGTAVEVGGSVGIALAPQHGATLGELMRAADLAMYQAKAEGRGRVAHFTDTIAAAVAERARLDEELRRALARDEFTLVFQPQIGARDGAVVAVEALLRWQHPEDGPRLPATFIRRAEESGMIVEIGDWVIARVAETLARWGADGTGQRLAVNISQRELDHALFFRRLHHGMRAAHAPAALLELEISESLAMRCSREVLDALALLRGDGATISIDNFGTGYSNLARLRELPIDRIKLDRSVIEHIATRAEARTIAHAVISLVHGLGCEAVAEGIESDAQANVLRVIGCDVLQGYAVAPPMDEPTLITWARGQRQRLAV
ncbi:putative bifunctional diguanylate cyclase/phosphodiesterase [Hephaestia mangrovi]|uniref:putative bifunctional diguanylate cyclase/phosphodiesterase n=1 Tax=Hephaestia mangrovi TaxID=2873268 RepID=UPI001CA689C2|nr:EAL domain-containing protein [Hephaestia mangrovi]MBY8828129.1 EAL domain-containing protein [Hephaestia mangrovi]